MPSADMYRKMDTAKRQAIVGLCIGRDRELIVAELIEAFYKAHDTELGDAMSRLDAIDKRVARAEHTLQKMYDAMPRSK